MPSSNVDKSTANTETNLDIRPSAASCRLSPVTGEPNAYITIHDMTTDGLSVAVSQAVAKLSGVPATELVSDFSEYADPDAFNQLFRSLDADGRTDGFVVLTFPGYRVTVHGDGRIIVKDET